MHRIVVIFLFLSISAHAQYPNASDISRWQQRSQNVTIIRDHFGIPHIYAKTDADAVFGLMFAQCEDDFKRVEMNYVEKLGRLSEIEGEEKIYDDLLIRMLIDTAAAMDDYRRAPAWLKELCNAFADGINYYLHAHPHIKPAMLKYFMPWYPLLWTDGSIGAISTAGVTASDLKKLFAGKTSAGIIRQNIGSPTGSNGFAFAPAITAAKNAILYINPHVTFYFRPEVHVVSEEGLNVYGAVTWGQFFVYQGFNAHCGWMHTSGNADVADAYTEKIIEKNGVPYYLYDNAHHRVKKRDILIRYKKGAALFSRTFNTWYTAHGPVMARTDSGYISVKSNNRDMKGLIQSWKRTKSKGFEDFKKTMELRANTSNNTVFADAKGNIAYWHGNFIPKRDTQYNWSQPVDGTTRATEWKGLHEVEETVHLYNPSNGWIQNCNSTPFTAAGDQSPGRKNYPAYMAPDGEDFRGIRAVKLLGGQKDFTLEKVIAAGYDTYLAAFEVMLPPLLQALQKSDVIRTDVRIQQALEILSSWNYHTANRSIATTLAVHWGEKLLPSIVSHAATKGLPNDFTIMVNEFFRDAPGETLTTALADAINDLEKKYGAWKLEWGNINRFQRISSAIKEEFSDDQPSIPVPFASSLWGMLPSYNSAPRGNTKKRYGTDGNSFVCAVEFGKKIQARSLLAGGESGDPGSKHFSDQAAMYATGKFKDVLFYREDVLKHREEEYHPGHRRR